MGGYRFGKLLPYVAYAKMTQDDPRTYPNLPPVPLIRAVVDELIKAPLQSTWTLGARWDFAPSAAFKVQADRITPVDGPGSLNNVKPGFNGPVTVLAAGIDFVF
jgi:hypothetical protein